MRTIIKSAALALAATAAMAASAHATIVITTYTGNVSSGRDYTGVFGAAGSLAGAAFTAVFTTDTTAGLKGGFVPGQEEGYYGGSQYGTAPVTTAVLTINGVSFAFGGGYFGEDGIEGTKDCCVASVTSESHDLSPNFNPYYSDDIRMRIDSSFGGPPLPGIPGDLSTPFTYEVQAGDYIDSFMSIDNQVGEQEGALAYLNPTQVSATIAGAVPEPTIWGLMILGFGGVGAVLHRRRKGGCAVPEHEGMAEARF